MKNKFYKYIQTLQDTIISKLEMVDGKAIFREDKLLLLYSMPLSATAATLKTVKALEKDLQGSQRPARFSTTCKVFNNLQGFQNLVGLTKPCRSKNQKT